MKKWFQNKIFQKNKNTLLLIGVMTFLILSIFQVVLLCCGTYFGASSDDVVQYSPILLQYINYIKEGKLGLFNFTNNMGSSIFADVYYIPIDIFSFMTFILTFIMNDFIAFSVAELSKVFLGVTVFAYFLQRKGFKNSTVALLSLLYFSFGGPWVYLTFPTYFSLFFYLPVSLIVVDLYVKGKKWLLPIYGFILILYNFYNAYTLFLFMIIVYTIIMIRDDYKNFKDLFKKVFVFGLHIILSVVLSAFVLLPSILYILNYSVRTVSSFEFVFDIGVYYKMVYKLFVYETGVTSFAFDGDYIQKQFSYYIGILGLFMLGLLFLMKDRTSKIYKYSLTCTFVAMLIPAVSMLFSGVFVAYTRWFSFVNVLLIYLIGYVIETFNFKNINRKDTTKIVCVIGFFYVLALIFSLLNIFFGDKQTFSVYANNILSSFVLVLFGVFVSLYIIFYFVKKYEFMWWVFSLELVVAICINFFAGINDGNKIEFIQENKKNDDILSKIEGNDDELFRIYMQSELSVLNNFSRFREKLVNEKTFHSFISKYIFENLDLYYDSEHYVLFANNLNIYNPNYSRGMDYKYVVVEKKENYQKLSYMDIYYEDDNYIIYENKYYEPFYVYENYYDEQEVISLNENNDFLEYQKNIFKGVILEENNFKLNKIEYSLENSTTVKDDFIKDAELIKVYDNKYEIDLHKYTRFGYEGSVVLYSSNNDDILSIKIVGEEGKKECNYLNSIFICSYDGLVSKLEIETINEIKDLKYGIEVKEEEDTYLLLLADSKNGEYLNYDVDSRERILLRNEQEEKECFYGFCEIGDFEYNHVLVLGAAQTIIEEGKKKFYYSFDDLSYYFANNSDNLASNKKLTYNKSTIKVSYTRNSSSSNDQVVVLPVTYSEEWEISGNSEGYTLVRANGGYLGLVVESGVTDIDISITFNPKGEKEGLIISGCAIVIYAMYVSIIYYKGRKKKDEII